MPTTSHPPRACAKEIAPGYGRYPSVMDTTLRIATALVWISFGLGCKVLHLVPRHEAIVAMVLGEAVAGPVTVLVGIGETLLGLWILSRRWPRLCALVQTLAIASMNSLELCFARERLLAPWPMVAANIVFLAVGWYLALRTRPAPEVA